MPVALPPAPPPTSPSGTLTSTPASTPTGTDAPLARRALAVGVAGAAGLALVGSTPGAADAAAPPKRGQFRGAPLLGARERHLVTRFSYGLTPQLTGQVRRQGGATAWFERQLTPSSVSDRDVAGLASWWPSMALGAGTLWQRQIDGVEGGWEVMQDYQRWLLVRRIMTRRPVHEMMTELWMNHLNVPVTHDATFTYRVGYDAVVRRHALGKFGNLLKAAITHPAMGIYLDNAVSTKAHPNENLGRELLELHTVGRGAYDEDDVKTSARILTGYLVDMWDTWEARYSPEDHWTGSVSILGFDHPNAARDGRAVAAAYLDHLARLPATAVRIARKLALKFVGDEPSEALVARLARVYLDHDTAVKPVLRALVASPEFAAAAGAKVRDPGEDVVATYRALGVRIARPQGDDGDYAASGILWQADMVGAVPCGWPRPDGQPIDNESWSSPARLLASMDVHWTMAGGWWPSKGVAYRQPVDWLPTPQVRFDVLVDYLSQQLLGRRSTGTLLQACCQINDVTPATVVSAEHGVVKWGFPRLLGTVLSGPLHLSR